MPDFGAMLDDLDTLDEREATDEADALRRYIEQAMRDEASA